ncbi:MAG: hypothetical protein JWQ87_5036 [Candidatus Sulfotelmatobacter sp.]|nr:hypothetical protein [Candidatus Sulfotelmatobacter sp.]
MPPKLIGWRRLSAAEARSRSEAKAGQNQRLYGQPALRQNFFRAGHAQAGVIVILSLVCQILADAALLPPSLLWTARIAVPLAAILIPAGFFLSMLSPAASQPSSAVGLIYAGAVVLAVGVLLLGIGLIRSAISG